jgi:hypothetical protein
MLAVGRAEYDNVLQLFTGGRPGLTVRALYDGGYLARRY